MCAKRSEAKSHKRANQSYTPTSRWKQAIYQAEEELAAERRKVEGLESAIATFRRMEEEGVPWPGESATQN
jgi:hypothetical protein